MGRSIAIGLALVMLLVLAALPPAIAQTNSCSSSVNCCGGGTCTTCSSQGSNCGQGGQFCFSSISCSATCYNGQNPRCTSSSCSVRCDSTRCGGSLSIGSCDTGFSPLPFGVEQLIATVNGVPVEIGYGPGLENSNLKMVNFHSNVSSGRMDFTLDVQNRSSRAVSGVVAEIGSVDRAGYASAMKVANDWWLMKVQPLPVGWPASVRRRQCSPARAA